jgi:hypothetical protein
MHGLLLLHATFSLSYPLFMSAVNPNRDDDEVGDEVNTDVFKPDSHS